MACVKIFTGVLLIVAPVEISVELMIQCTHPAARGINWRKLVHDNIPMSCCYVHFGFCIDPSNVIMRLYQGAPASFHVIIAKTDNTSVIQ